MSAEQGRAVLFIMQQEGGRVTADEFFESASTTDPYHRALHLWQSVEDDFPGAAHAIYANERARELKGAAIMAAMGFDS